MQMYKVTFHSQRGQLVETGKYLVCASDAESANALVAGFRATPLASARFDASRVKPSIYELSRSEFTLADAIPMLSGAREEEPGAVHEITASAKVYAYSEPAALRRFASAVIEQSSATKTALPKHVNELNINVQRADHRPAPSRIEEQSIYREKRIFSGGAARPR